MSEPLECLEHGRGCAGPVEYRHPLSPTGISYPRCGRHWSDRCADQERIDRTFPDSPIPPEWFDPLAAGERWDEDY